MIFLDVSFIVGTRKHPYPSERCLALNRRSQYRVGWNFSLADSTSSIPRWRSIALFRCLECLNPLGPNGHRNPYFVCVNGGAEHPSEGEDIDSKGKPFATASWREVDNNNDNVGGEFMRSVS